MQSAAQRCDLDHRQIGGARVAKPLRKTWRECKRRAVGQLHNDQALACVVARRRGARLRCLFQPTARNSVWRTGKFLFYPIWDAGFSHAIHSRACEVHPSALLFPSTQWPFHAPSVSREPTATTADPTTRSEFPNPARLRGYAAAGDRSDKPPNAIGPLEYMA